MEVETLAAELYRELKKSSRKWFILFCVMVGIYVVTVVGFVLFISHRHTYRQKVNEVEQSSVVQVIGGGVDEVDGLDCP